ncbi:MAG: thiamine pyrophosphate-dependent enzyme [Spirochaetales bacterium]|nr:thiamine pyrophosphate-dependent enzyme [Spirochaetales bacterium]
MAVVFSKTKGLTPKETHYCPGCTHGIIHRLVGEVLEEMDRLDYAIGVAPVGCAVFAYNYFNCDMHEAAHGRAPAVATGIKRVLPDRTVFSYQGDGDLASIGTAEIVHAAHRAEKITVIFVNNAIYGMTGGQMAPTTLLGQKTTTSPYGREESHTGRPIRISEMLATIDGATFIERTSVHSPQHIRKTKKAIREAFTVQQKGLGFSMVEILSTCPTNWGMTPIESLAWLEENMIPYYPLGNFRKPGDGADTSSPEAAV